MIPEKPIPDLTALQPEWVRENYLGRQRRDDLADSGVAWSENRVRNAAHQAKVTLDPDLDFFYKQEAPDGRNFEPQLDK